MRFFFALIVILYSAAAFSQTPLNITTAIYQNYEETFHSHIGEGQFDSTLAMSIRYSPIKSLREQIQSALKINLDYFKGWNPNGEAHVTVITPVEFYHVLKNKLSMKEIEAIADKYDIQESMLSLHGIGSAKEMVEGKEEETFFVIVDSANLRNIRQQIFYEFTRRGGDRGAFDPAWFFPHITIGYTKRDLHESDGVKKNLKHSYDKRFALKFNYGLSKGSDNGR
jgi:2'-5' RNA ligase